VILPEAQKVWAAHWAYAERFAGSGVAGPGWPRSYDPETEIAEFTYESAPGEPCGGWSDHISNILPELLPKEE
jgi:hypothetical protein